MPEINIFEKILSQYGFGVFMAIVTIALFYLVLKWAKDYLDRVLKQSELREQCLMDTINKQNSTIDTHTAQSNLFHSQIMTASDYQRKEHDRMICILEEHSKILARVNGR